MLALRLVDKNLRYFINYSGGSGAERPEIDRHLLREILLNSLSEKTKIHWGHRLRKLEYSGHGIELYFDQSTKSGFDLVVGADGAWSKVRSNILPEIAPQYSGLGGFMFTLPNAELDFPNLSRLVNRGSLFSFSDGKSLILQQMGDGSISCASWSLRPVNWEASVAHNFTDSEAVKSRLLKIHHDWHPVLTAAIKNATNFSAKSLYMLPIGYSWKHKSRITLIGDSAHLMTPFAGEGVNTAMKDSLDLAEAIVESSKNNFKDLEAKIMAFEAGLFQRGKKVQQKTYSMMSMMFFRIGAPASTIGSYISFALEDAVPNPTVPLLTVVIKIFFFFWNLLGLGTGLQKQFK
jgi:2-polyprenyl-6-methoxyphenol hydroxylase-like FAD-dependent oxidoreductase